MLTGQAGRDPTDVSITIEYDPSSIVDLVPSNDTSLVTDPCSLRNILLNLVLIVVILLVFLILYLLSRLT